MHQLLGSQVLADLSIKRPNTEEEGIWRGMVHRKGQKEVHGNQDPSTQRTC